MTITDLIRKFQKYPAYQDSNVDWIGNVPENWKVKRLKFVVDIIKRIVGSEGPDVLSITQQGIKVKDVTSGEGQLAMDYSKYQVVNKGDFAMNHMDLLTGYVDVSKFDGVISPDYRVFNIIDKEVSTEYLLLLFQKGYKDKIFYAFGQGVSQLGRWRFPADNFNNFRIPVPPIEEQTAIAKFLDNKTAKIDEAITQKEKLIALLKERKQILIQNAVTKGLDKNAKMTDSCVEWTGEIPEHWEVKKIKHVTSKIGSGITPSGGGTTYLDEGGIPLLRSQNVHFGRIDLSDVARISEVVHESMKNSQVKNGDVLLNITGGSIGRCHYVETNEPLNVNQHVCIVRPKTIETKYLNFLLASEIGQGQIWFFQQGGGREGLNFQALKNFFIPYPSKIEQNSIVSYIKSQSAKIDKAISLQEQQIEKLKEYKSVLIDSAVTGKIKVC